MRADGVKRLVVDGELFWAYGCFGLSEAMAAQSLAGRERVLSGNESDELAGVGEIIDRTAAVSRGGRRQA